VTHTSEAPDGTDGAANTAGERTARVDTYASAGEVAGIAEAGGGTVAFGYHERIAEQLSAGTLAPDVYLDVTSETPDGYVAAMADAGADVYDAADLRERADGLYADGFSVAPGVGVVPCNPERTVALRLRDGADRTDLVVSNAAADDPALDAPSLSGAVPTYGEAEGVSDPLADDLPDGPAASLLGDAAASRADDLLSGADRSGATVAAADVGDGVRVEGTVGEAATVTAHEDLPLVESGSVAADRAPDPEGRGR
jgi:hypothetical protein